MCCTGQADRPPPSEGREEQLRADWAGAGTPGGDHQVHVQRRPDPQGQPLLPGAGATQKVKDIATNILRKKLKWNLHFVPLHTTYAYVYLKSFSFGTVVRIHDICYWYGSDDPYLWLTDPAPDPPNFCQWPSSWQLKIIFSYVFLLVTFSSYIYIIFQR
jgi:hypothetical protein